MTDANPTPLRILLVDDSRVARLTLQHLLKSTGFEISVAEAANGDEALAAFTPGQFDLALIDFNMPGMDGIELAGELRKQDPLLRMALVTANIQDSIVERARSMDMAFLGKPVTPEQLSNLIRG
ncbi:response regulator [Marinospirillum alkaliphilum]|uniref:Response regulator receiver domain-containing protein n=1 Tax=Marinospirillum alkaliphilum DSM 21637 TaxID=1122209 RepID=A0A1K1U484_9GAMM|nr:response regulator [Marinospirillum alkaliphilum]SFX07703.1 Response regulator receiver domain-containing protein [Marinospirillum alkaliphilum DSM 21637]